MLLAIALSSVLSIDIETSSSYKGRTFRPVAVHIVRDGSAFISNGAPVPGAAVQALIDALNAPAMSDPTPESLRVGGSALDSIETSSMQECDGVALTQAAQDAYRLRFTDAAALATYLHSYYAKPTATDALIRTMSVVVTSGSDRVTASSSSTKAGMLPFSLDRGSATETTYDASLPEAIGAFLPMSPASMSLRLDELTRGWALSVCDKDMTDLAFREALPQTIAFAHDHALVVQGSVHGNPMNGLTAVVRRGDTPRIAMLYNADLRGGDAASVMALQSCGNVLHRIASIP